MSVTTSTAAVLTLSALYRGKLPVEFGTRITDSLFDFVDLRLEAQLIHDLAGDMSRMLGDPLRPQLQATPDSNLHRLRGDGR